jgi:hypothetical protein
MTRTLAGLALAGIASLAGASALHAQRLEGAATAQRVVYDFKDDVGSARQTGTYVGLSGSIGLGIVRLGAGFLTGTLTGGDGLLSSRSIRTTLLTASVKPVPALELGLEAQARHESIDTSVVLQRLGGLFSRFTQPFGDGGLEGTAELAFFPVTSSTNSDPIKTALRAGVGARFVPNGGPFLIAVGYRLFRMDHQDAASGTARLEQEQLLVFEVGLRH